MPTNADDPTSPEPQPLPWPGDGLAEAVLIAAAVAAAVILVVAAVAAWPFLTSDASHTLATALSVPLVLVGVTLTCAGVAMAVIEWRAGFVQPPVEVASLDAAEDASKIVDSVGKLKGPALVTVAGLVLLLGAAWVAASAASG